VEAYGTGGTSDRWDLNRIPGRIPPTSPEEDDGRQCEGRLDLGLDGMRIEKKENQIRAR